MPLTERESILLTALDDMSDALQDFSRADDTAKVDRATAVELVSLRRDLELILARVHELAQIVNASTNTEMSRRLEKIEIYLTNRDDVAALALSIDSLRDRVKALEPTAAAPE